jgi:hypothetical protein
MATCSQKGELFLVICNLQRRSHDEQMKFVRANTAFSALIAQNYLAFFLYGPKNVTSVCPCTAIREIPWTQLLRDSRIVPHYAKKIRNQLIGEG